MRASLLERAVGRLKDGLDLAAGRITVELRSANEAIEDLGVVPGRKDFLSYGVGEGTGTAQAFDFIVAASELLFPEAGKQVPATGWLIFHKLADGRTGVFEVVPGGPEARAYDPIDQLGILYRVHTELRRIDEAGENP